MPADHQILTNHGFLFLDQVLDVVRRDPRTGAVRDWRGLRVANYDPDTQQLVYDEPHAIVVKHADRLVELTSRDAAAAWSSADAASKSDAHAPSISLLTTPDHQVFVQPAAPLADGGSDSFHKMTAAQAAALPALRLLTRADNGVAHGHVSAATAAAPDDAVLELYGMWLRSGGAMSDAHSIVLERTRAVADRLCALGLHGGVAGVDGTLTVDDAKLCALFGESRATALAPWCFALPSEAARAVLRGLVVDDAVHVPSAGLRDDIVRLALHAGRAAHFEPAAAAAGGGGGGWRVVLDDGAANVRPLLERDRDQVREVANALADDRVWCFAMPRRRGGTVEGVGGFVVTRRAVCGDHSSEAAAVLQASRPTIQGNCFDSEVMLVTELLEGDLTQLLHSEHGKNMSLYQKCHCARDIASGMAWLHHIQVVHLDLKPTNILYDANGRMKVADFGLARFKSEDGYIPGACGGTPLYSAPEVLMKEDFTDKADVYSFALIFSFILSGVEPYAGFTAWDDFFAAVVTQGHRPVLPPATPRRIRRLIESCWAFDPDVRPSFIEILAILELALLDAAIEDPIGRRIWKTFFFDTKTYEHCTINRLISTVTWDDFMRMLETLLYIPDGPVELPSDLVDAPLGMTPTDSQLYLAPDRRLHEYSRLGGETAQRRVDNEIERRNRVIELQCLKTLLARDQNVKVERFGFICKLFGPVVGSGDDSGEAMLARIATLMNQTWFHGDLSSSDAYIILRDKKPGSFLVRFSSSQWAFCISSVVSKSTKPQLGPKRSSSDDDDDDGTPSPPPATSNSTGRARPLSQDPTTNRLRIESGDKWSGSSSSPSALKKARPRVEDLQELDAVVHVMIERDASGFRYPGAEQTYETINELVEASDKLTRPCSVSKKRFGYIFSALRASHFGYIDSDAKSRGLFASGTSAVNSGNDDGDDDNTPPPPTAAPADHHVHKSSRSKEAKEKVPSRPASSCPDQQPGGAAPAPPKPTTAPPVPSKPPPGVAAAVSISSNSKSPDSKRSSRHKKSKSSSALGTTTKEATNPK
jgi:hypothetical protein